MGVLEAIIMGVVQGLTEFLPVSSSGHLQLASFILGTEIDPDSSLTFSLTLHAATVLSTIVVLWQEIWKILKGSLDFSSYNENHRYCVNILVSMIPVGIVGLCFKDWIETAFSSLWVVGAMLILTSVLLAFAYKARWRERENITLMDSFVIGLAQACAVMPGLSRSGSTIAAGLILGNRKEKVAEFSFLMVLPPIIGNALLDILDGEFGGGVETMSLIAGFISAFIVGTLACRFMIDIVRRGKLIWFAIYCFIVGAVALGVSLF